MEEGQEKAELFEWVGRTDAESASSSAPSVSYGKDAWRRLKQNKVAILSVIILILIILFALLGPAICRFDYRTQDAACINHGPNLTHWFGTDSLGRDLFARCGVGARVSLFIALVATLINVLIGVAYGGISGFLGGRTDMIMMRGVEIIYSVPETLWVILLMVIMGSGLRTIIIAIAITGWASMARLVRGQVLQLKNSEYVMASRLLGASNTKIILRDLVPNISGQIIIELTFDIPTAIFTEAMLSYLGMGVPVPLASWGTLANDGAKVLTLYPYQLLFPALLISLTMLGFNLFGDGLRDALDPNLRR